MCGIVGYSGKNKLKQEDLKVLLYFAEDRGDESCGVATPKDLFKKAEDPHEFIVRTLPTDKVVIGHTRRATRGKVTDANAHPFQKGKFTGIHNGSIHNFDELQKEEETDYNVDSQIIWHLFDKYGLKKALPKMRGWLALAWIDDKDRLNLYRHNAPIYYGYRNGNLFFGSKEIYLEAIDCEDIEMLRPWKQYIIDEGEIVDKIELRDYKPKKYKYNNNNWGTRGAGGQSAQSGGTNSTEDSRGNDRSDSGQSKSSDDFPKPDNVPDYADFISSYNPPGVAYYFWFKMTGEPVLYVQPTAPLLEDFTPPVERFNLTKHHSVARLQRNYPDVVSHREVYSKVPADAW